MKSTASTIEPENWNRDYREYLIRFALQRISDYGTAEDLVQETFLSGWNARSRFRGDCSEKTWLTGILRNKIIDQYRKTGRRPSVLTSDLDQSLGSEPGNVSWIDLQRDEKTTSRPEAETERHEFMRDLETAISTLPDKMGQAFLMREVHGQSTTEITNQLDITKANLWVLIHRAKQALSEELSSTWDGIDEFGGRQAA